MRIIDADALFAEFENVGWYNNADRDEIAERLVLQAPTIDAVSVVRCGECKWGSDKRAGESVYCEWHGFPWNINGFCSYGERKDDE